MQGQAAQTPQPLYLWYLALRDGRLVSARAIDMMRTPHVRTAKQFEQSYGLAIVRPGQLATIPEQWSASVVASLRT
jgi:hypothetical protein